MTTKKVITSKSSKTIKKTKIKPIENDEIFNLFEEERSWQLMNSASLTTITSKFNNLFILFTSFLFNLTLFSSYSPLSILTLLPRSSFPLFLSSILTHSIHSLSSQLTLILFYFSL